MSETIDTDWRAWKAAYMNAMVNLVPKWFDIDTAPKDGEPILAFSEGVTRVAYWSRSELTWRDAYSARLLDTPTHWMPLPEAPTIGIA